MQGFVYSIPGLKDGRAMQWSHMLGVAPSARGSGLGVELKLAQREATLAMGLDLIEWTYDPLQAINANLNFGRLGVVVEDYEENVYGESSSPLHRGTPTDRFIAQWQLRAPHVERRVTAGAVVMRDQSVTSAPVVNPSRDGSEWRRPGEATLDLDDRRLLVEIPTGFGEMQRKDPDLALEWRLSTRRIFQHYLEREYPVVDFFLARDAGRGQYPACAVMGPAINDSVKSRPRSFRSPSIVTRLALPASWSKIAGSNHSLSSSSSRSTTMKYSPGGRLGIE